jgi:hypothetical protein
MGLSAYFIFLNTARPKNSLAKAESQQQAATKDQAAAKEANHSPEPAASKPAATSPSAAAPSAASAQTAPTSAANRPLERAKVTNQEEATAGNATKAASKAAGHSQKPAAIPGTAAGTVQTTTEWERYTRNESKFIRMDTIPPGSLQKERGMAFYKTDTPDQLVFTGKVIDQHNKPLPGAALYLAGNYSVNTTTDKNGLFSLKIPKKDSVFKLTVAYVGYEQASLGLGNENRTGNIIQLQPQANALSEVVVTGYGSKRKEIIREDSKPRKEFLTKRAAPTDGWPAYKNYLEGIKKAINPDSTLKGDLTISFLVNKEGVLSSFKVEQSLSPDQDSAAIHLIQQGPSWKLLKGNKARAWVTIPF